MSAYAEIIDSYLEQSRVLCRLAHHFIFKEHTEWERLMMIRA
jgi:hypothetical protein